MISFYLLLFLIISPLSTCMVKSQRIYYENEKVYFPGKTNEQEVRINRLNIALSNNIITEANSNHIENIERPSASRRNTNSILNALNTIRELKPVRRTPDANTNINPIKDNRFNDKIQNSSEDSVERSSTSSSSKRRTSSKNSNEVTTSTLVTTKPTLQNLRVCEKKYAEYIQRIFPLESDTASDANDAEFNGRVLAEPGEYPHMTALGFRAENGRVDYKCGGSLISESFVITAAHCANLTGQQPSKVRIGDLNLMIEESYLEPQIRNIKKIYVHPEYKTSSYYNDIALLELIEEVELTEFVRPIRLWTQFTIPFTTAYAMGYGATEFARERTNRLTDLNMTIVANDDCNREMPKLPETERGIISSQICARDFALNRDTCQGDSGGPLQLNIRGRRRKNRLHYQLIGITSYGLFCRSSYPSIFTRVYSFLDWIEHIVWKDNFN